MCSNLGGGRGNTISDKIAGNKANLNYAQVKKSEAMKALNYTNSKAARDNADSWDNEVKRLQNERNKLESYISKYKTVKQAPEFIKEQVGLDISKYRNSASQQFEKRGQITIDISGMKQSDKTKLSNALRQKYSPYTGEQSGTWLFTIKKKKTTNTLF